MSVFQMKVLFCVGLVVMLAVLSVVPTNDQQDIKNSPVTIIPRDNEAMVAFGQKLAAAQPGDLIVMFPSSGKQFPMVYHVNYSLKDGFIDVNSITGCDTVYTGVIPPTSVSKFVDFYRVVGAVHIIPKERAESFYLQVGSAAFMQGAH